MATQQLSGTTAIVTGASRGFGRGIAAALAQAGAQVVGVARDATALDEVREQLGAAFTPVADAADPVVAGQLIDRYQPRVLPGLTPATRLGQGGVAAYAAREGVDVATFLENRGPALEPDQAGEEIAGLITHPAHGDGACLLSASGIKPVA
jgi:short chain dehydrogenase